MTSLLSIWQPLLTILGVDETSNCLGKHLLFVNAVLLGLRPNNVHLACLTVTPFAAKKRVKGGKCHCSNVNGSVTLASR